MELGPHAGFIVAAYAACAAVVVALIGWIVSDYRTQLRVLADLESRGSKRRSAPTPRATP